MHYGCCLDPGGIWMAIVKHSNTIICCCLPAGVTMVHFLGLVQVVSLSPNLFLTSCLSTFRDITIDVIFGSVCMQTLWVFAMSFLLFLCWLSFSFAFSESFTVNIVCGTLSLMCSWLAVPDMQCKGSVQDYYSILGVGKNADKSEIKSGEYL